MWLQKENDQDPYNRATPPPTPASVGSGAGGGAPIGAGEGNQTTPTPAGTSSTAPTPQPKFASVQDYLGANKEQGNQLGQKFQTGLEATKAKDTSAIDTAAGNVTKQAQDATVNYNPDLVNTAFNNPVAVANNKTITPTTTVNTGSGWGSHPVNVPTGPSTSYKLDDFLKQWNASYAGPASFEGTQDYNKADDAATDAQTHATEVGDAGGRKQLLQDDYGVYGQGNKGLDQTLLQNSDNFGKVLDTGKQLASLPDYLASKASGVNAATAKAAATTDATKKNTQDLFQNSLTDFQTGINNKVSADQQQASGTVNQVKSDLAAGDATKIAADLSKSNLSPSDRASIQDYLTKLNGTYGVKPDLNNYYTYNPATDINKDTVATADDYAKAAALQKLTGVDYSGVLNPANASKANTWNQSTSGFNGPSLQTYLKSSLGQQDKELLGKTDLGDVSAKLNMPSIVDPKNFSNADLGSKAAQSLITIAKRNGMGRGENGTSNNLDNLYHQAAVSLVHTAGGGALDTKNPAIAGILQFVRQLGTYLYGAPQY